MGMVIRVLYNNRDWKSACVRPGMDSLCQKCFAEDNLDIKGPAKNDEVCTGICWERDICKNFEWGCTPKGRKFGSRVYEGVKVFFVFQQPDHKYTLWGVTKIEAVNVPPRRILVEHEIGYNQWIRLAPFEPLPKEKWVRDLTDIQLVDEQIRQGRYRFISPEKEAELENRIKGISPQMSNRKLPKSSPTNKVTTFTLTFAPNIHSRLMEVSNAEGRQPEDIIKEAIAEWLRARGGLTLSE